MNCSARKKQQPTVVSGIYYKCQNSSINFLNQTILLALRRNKDPFTLTQTHRFNFQRQYVEEIIGHTLGMAGVYKHWFESDSTPWPNARSLFTQQQMGTWWQHWGDKGGEERNWPPYLTCRWLRISVLSNRHSPTYESIWDYLYLAYSEE